MVIEPIAFFRSPFTTKFGVPRQSGIVDELRGRIVFTDAYRQPEALRGLEDYDYLWLIWGFSEHVEAEKHPTVRPPLLGGNERIGVWATRSPFRPNNLGLSSVRIAAVDLQQPAIDVLGADLMDGTPIYDIKPYLPYVDSHPDVRGGFTDQHAWHRLEVVVAAAVLCRRPGRPAPDAVLRPPSPLSCRQRPHLRHALHGLRHPFPSLCRHSHRYRLGNLSTLNPQSWKYTFFTRLDTLVSTS